MDGENANPDCTYISKEGWHPESCKFILFQGCYIVGKSDVRMSIMIDDSASGITTFLSL